MYIHVKAKEVCTQSKQSNITHVTREKQALSKPQYYCSIFSKNVHMQECVCVLNIILYICTCILEGVRVCTK